MAIDRTHAQSIARDLITKIASDWPPVATSRCTKRRNQYIFEFVLGRPLYTEDPIDLRPGDSLVRFNPLKEATEIVLDHFERLKHIADVGMREEIVRLNAETRIQEMIGIAPLLFWDASWHAGLLAEVKCTMAVMHTFGNPKAARETLESALELVRQKMKKRLPPIPSTKNPKINQFTINHALKTFFPKYKDTGEIPSQRQFAKVIDVTPKAWRTYLANHSLPRHEDTVKRWFDFMLAKESEPNRDGDFLLPV